MSDIGADIVAHFSTKNPINKPAMNNKRILIAAVSFFTTVEKDNKKDHKMTQNSVSFSYQLTSFQMMHTFST